LSRHGRPALRLRLVVIAAPSRSSRKASVSPPRSSRLGEPVARSWGAYRLDDHRRVERSVRPQEAAAAAALLFALSSVLTGWGRHVRGVRSRGGSPAAWPRHGVEPVAMYIAEIAPGAPARAAGGGHQLTIVIGILAAADRQLDHRVAFRSGCGRPRGRARRVERGLRLAIHVHRGHGAFNPVLSRARAPRARKPAVAAGVGRAEKARRARPDWRPATRTRNGGESSAR